MEKLTEIEPKFNLKADSNEIKTQILKEMEVVHDGEELEGGTGLSAEFN